jgi:hypothetical protein
LREDETSDEDEVAVNLEENTKRPSLPAILRRAS